MATANFTASPMKSKTDQAIDYMNANKVTAYAAAQHFGIKPETIYRRRKLLQSRVGTCCPHCGQMVKEA